MWAEFFLWDFVVVCLIVFVLLMFAESPAEFFADNKNIAGFDNVRFIRVIDLIYLSS